LGTRTPGGPTYDLHRPDIIFDEDAIGIGVRLLVQTVILAGAPRRHCSPVGWPHER